ncbi:anti-repressor SinI family protein [Niallia sp. 01092]|uniref:anti-repressor SinI family protein n=1 Tax=unclassified Niallia TaxID=2837522 RepID=UPI003FCF172A
MKSPVENTHFETPNLYHLERKIDQEWYLLIMQAKKLGLSTTEVRNFLQKRCVTDPESH